MNLWKNKRKIAVLFLCTIGLSGCGTKTDGEGFKDTEQEQVLYHQNGSDSLGNESVVKFDHELDEYKPLKASIIFILPIKRCIPGGMPLPLEWKMRPSSLRRRGLL